ncbi:MAG: mandelate racemase, partial [Acetobacteraceae bacterium]|nr:mandelate racemase [Acetobacteraceae bacterium]
MTASAMRVEVPVTDIEVGAYTIATDAPEADGTLAWDATTIVVVQA